MQLARYHSGDDTPMINHIPGCITMPKYVQQCSSGQATTTSTYRILLLLHGGKQLWRHPWQRATHVPTHKRCRLLLGQAQVSNFDDWSVEVPQIAQQVVTLQVKVDDST